MSGFCLKATRCALVSAPVACAESGRPSALFVCIIARPLRHSHARTGAHGSYQHAMTGESRELSGVRMLVYIDLPRICKCVHEKFIKRWANPLPCGSQKHILKSLESGLRFCRQGVKRYAEGMPGLATFLPGSGNACVAFPAKSKTRKPKTIVCAHEATQALLLHLLRYALLCHLFLNAFYALCRRTSSTGSISTARLASSAVLVASNRAARSPICTSGP